MPPIKHKYNRAMFKFDRLVCDVLIIGAVFFLWPSSILFGTVWGNTAWTLPLYLLHARVSKTRSDARTHRQSWSNDITYQHGRDAEITRWHPSLPVWRGSRKWRGGGGGDSVSSSLFFFMPTPLLNRDVTRRASLQWRCSQQPEEEEKTSQEKSPRRTCPS